METNTYKKHRSKMAARSREQSREARDIAPLPKVINPRRKAKCRLNFCLFCEKYLHHTFSIPWSKDHLKAIAKIERAVLQGGLFAFAMPRGSGKTSLCEAACIWAVLYGHRSFVFLIGASESAAVEMMGSIKTELEVNETLGADFPAACYPIQCLERITRRGMGQLCRGKPTYIGWGADELVLPTIARSVSSGAIIKVAGITGRIRGMKFKRPDGQSVRPELVVIDDPQTDESSRSLSQCQYRLKVLTGAVLGLAGPKKKSLVFFPVR